MWIRFFSLPLIISFCIGCSVYKSQGRKDFETDTPARVPIALTFYCRDNHNISNSSVQVVELADLKSRPGLKLHATFNQGAVHLLASSANSDQICISNGLDLDTYIKNQELLLYQVDTWP